MDVLIVLETFFKEIKELCWKAKMYTFGGLAVYVTKKRARKIGRNIKRNLEVEIPEHYIPAFKPSRTFLQAIKDATIVKQADTDSAPTSVE